MKKIKNQVTTMTENQAKFGGSADVHLDYTNLIEICLDIVPQGGFTPKDIRERNRIQNALDEFRKNIKLKSKEGKEICIEFEDQDYKSLISIVKLSRWTVRNKDLQDFLSLFDKDEE